MRRSAVPGAQRDRGVAEAHLFEPGLERRHIGLEAVEPPGAEAAQQQVLRRRAHGGDGRGAAVLGGGEDRAEAAQARPPQRHGGRAALAQQAEQRHGIVDRVRAANAPSERPCPRASYASAEKP